MAEGEERDPFSWQELATNMQQKYLNSFGQVEWDSYEYSEQEYLEKKVGFGLFGPPPELPFTVVERIAGALMKGDVSTFLLFLPEKDFASLRVKAYEFIRERVSRVIFPPGDGLFNYKANKENEIIKSICNSVLFNDKKVFLNYLYFSESDWDYLTRSLQVFLEQQVANVLNTTKQTEIIRRVCEALLTPDKKRFMLYLTESTWISCQDAARQLLVQKIGKKLFGSKLFGFNAKEKEKIEKLCDAILDGDVVTFLKFLPHDEWHVYQTCLQELYKEKVGNCLFGSTGKLIIKKENRTGYTTKQYETIQKVCSMIIQTDCHGQSSKGETYMNMIFVCLEIKVDDGTSHALPITIFRVPSDAKESVCFIDSNARVYKNWNDFLENNELPQCKYCYPRDGVYQTDKEGCVLVDFGETPASKITKKTLNVLDQANTGVMVGSMVVSLAALAVPVAAPLLAVAAITTGASGAYSVVRGSGALVDRAQHNQSIGLEDSDARSCWLMIAGSAFGVASMGATSALTTMTQAGRVVGTAGRLTTTVLNLSSLAVNGLGIMHGAYMLHTKHQEGELTPLDIFQFSASVLFFTHSAVNFRTADTIITETQTDVIQKYQDNLRSNRHRKMFRKVARNTQKDMNPVEGRAKVIRTLRKIENRDDFFAGLVRSDKDFRKAKSTVKFSDMGAVEINGELTVDPMKFSQINKEQRQIILNATKNLAQGNISVQEYMTTTDPIFTQKNVSLTQVEISDRSCSVRDLMDVINFPEVSADGQAVMQLTVLYETVEIVKILSEYDRKLHLRLLEVAVRLSEVLGWTTSNRFVNVLQFVCRSLYRVASEMDRKYTEDLDNAKFEAGSSFDQEAFDRNYNINGKRFECFCFVALEQFINPYILDSLKIAYTSYYSNNNEVESSIGETASGGQSNPDLAGDMCTQRESYYSNNNESERKSGGSNPGNDSVLDPVLKYTKQNCFVKLRQFQVDEDIIVLTEDEIFDIVQEVTDMLVDSTNCFLEYQGMDVNACIRVPFGPATYVKIMSNFDEGFLSAFAYYNE